jgi:hypothetical protein
MKGLDKPPIRHGSLALVRTRILEAARIIKAYGPFMANKRSPKKDVLGVTRREVREIEPLIREAVRRQDFEAYMEILTSRLGVERGSDQRCFFESKF